MAARVFTGLQRKAILQWLALGFTPIEIVRFVKQDFGTVCSRQNIHKYAGNHEAEIEELKQQLGDKLEDLPFGSKVERVSHLGVVARKIWRKLEEAEGNKSIRDMAGSFASILKQISEETGQLVHKHEMTGAGGGPMRHQVEPDLENLSDEQLAAIREIYERRPNAVAGQGGAGEA